MDLDQYAQMRKEIASLWENLRQSSKSSSEINHKISNISNIALNIGGKVRDDAEQLHRDVYQFLEGMLDKNAIERMYRDALKLEQETREL